MTETVVIVGAGTAGCTVAAKLSEDPARSVILLDSGPDLSEMSELQSVNWLDALSQRDAFYPNLYARKVEGGERLLYQRGRGVGGSASTNAMLALPGLPWDYENYATKYGLKSWGWSEVKPWFAKLKPTLTRSDKEEQTPVDRAVLNSASVLGLPDFQDSYLPDDGSALLYRTADKYHRQSSLELWLDPARDRSNLDIRPEAQVESVLFEGTRAVGVCLVNGTKIDADKVILCAGTFESPAILLRSGMKHPGIGQGLQDHPAASIYFTMKPEFREADPSIPCIGSVMRFSSSVGRGDLHLLPLHGELLPGSHGLLMAAVMNVKSFGSLALDPENPNNPPIVNQDMLSHPDDKLAMREALAGVQKVLSSEAFQGIIEDVFVDEQGTPPEALQTDEFYSSWIKTHVDDYFHAVGTARMGAEGDPMAVTDQLGSVVGTEGLSVWDASILPEVPSANTQLPVAMLAERLSAAYVNGELV